MYFLWLCSRKVARFSFAPAFSFCVTARSFSIHRFPTVPPNTLCTFPSLYNPRPLRGLSLPASVRSFRSHPVFELLQVAPACASINNPFPRSHLLAPFLRFRSASPASHSPLSPRPLSPQMSPSSQPSSCIAAFPFAHAKTSVNSELPSASVLFCSLLHVLQVVTTSLQSAPSTVFLPNWLLCLSPPCVAESLRVGTKATLHCLRPVPSPFPYVNVSVVFSRACSVAPCAAFFSSATRCFGKSRFPCVHAPTTFACTMFKNGLSLCSAFFPLFVASPQRVSAIFVHPFPFPVPSPRGHAFFVLVHVIVFSWSNPHRFLPCITPTSLRQSSRAVAPSLFFAFGPSLACLLRPFPLSLKRSHPPSRLLFPAICFPTPV
ncbi:hypothetical protein TRVL_06167 [Trypanosoma vivax]|nr:hypothetical protein TRVL_06167 [Trypanosoma vivax]